MASVCEVCGVLVTMADCHYAGGHKYYHRKCFAAANYPAARAALAERALQAMVEYDRLAQQYDGAAWEMNLRGMGLAAQMIAAELAELEAQP